MSIGDVRSNNERSMPRPERGYRDIIIAIHTRRNGPFAVWELSKITKNSRPTVRRVLDKLRQMAYVVKAPRGYNSKVWRTRTHWPQHACRRVIEDYELWQLTSVQRVNRKRRLFGDKEKA